GAAPAAARRRGLGAHGARGAARAARGDHRAAGGRPDRAGPRQPLLQHHPAAAGAVDPGGPEPQPRPPRVRGQHHDRGGRDGRLRRLRPRGRVDAPRRAQARHGADKLGPRGPSAARELPLRGRRAGGGRPRALPGGRHRRAGTAAGRTRRLRAARLRPAGGGPHRARQRHRRRPRGRGPPAGGGAVVNLATALALLSLTLTDPTGDAIGDGTLNPPTSPIYANSALFDLQAVELEVSEGGVAVLKVTMGALSATAPQPSAAPAPDAAAPEDGPTAVAEQAAATREPGLEPFDVSGLLAVIDVYLDTAAGGATRTLSGPDMLMPLGVGWDHAVRLSAAGAQGVSYVGSGAAAPEAAARLPSAEPVTLPADPEAAPTAAGDGAAPGATQEAAPAPEELLYVPLTVDRRGNVLEIRLPWSLDPESHVDLYAMTGVHDPFSTDGWRRLADAPSPWAFSGPAQVTPVIDLLASDADAQAGAVRRGGLPLLPREPGMSLPLSPWLWMMIGGVALALSGLVMRGRVARLPGADDAGAGGEGEVAVVEPPAGDAHERDEREPADEPRDAPPAGPDRAPGRSEEHTSEL